MSVKHAIWKVGSPPSPLSTGKLPNEQLLEDMIVSAPQIVSGEWMLIGRQEQTGLGGRIDLLAIAPDASLVLIELKRNRTPREIVAQALDYASWVEQLAAEQIAQIYGRFSNGKNLDEAFKQRFGTRTSAASWRTRLRTARSHFASSSFATCDGRAEPVRRAPPPLPIAGK